MDFVRGRVVSFSEKDGYGYLRYPKDGELKDVWFAQDQVCGNEILATGDTVDFEVFTGSAGDIAINIHLFHRKVTVEGAHIYSAPCEVTVHTEGVIRALDTKTGVYWLDSHGQRHMCHINDVVPNRIGCRVFPVGSPVEYELGSTSRGPRAFVVTDVRAATAGINLETYQEIGWLCRWDTTNRYGFIVRPRSDGAWTSVGDELFCSYDELRTTGEEDFPNGVWLRYKIGTGIKKKQNRRVYFAREIEVLVSEPETEIAPAGSFEEIFLNSADPIEPQPAAAPDKPEVEHVYTKAERKLTLKQLIARQLVA